MHHVDWQKLLKPLLLLLCASYETFFYVLLMESLLLILCDRTWALVTLLMLVVMHACTR